MFVLLFLLRQILTWNLKIFTPETSNPPISWMTIFVKIPVVAQKKTKKRIQEVWNARIPILKLRFDTTLDVESWFFRPKKTAAAFF